MPPQVRDKADPTTLKFLSKLMDEIEKEKVALGNIEDPKVQIVLFAIDLFDKADTQFRAGRADKRTAITFRAASVLMVLHMPKNELNLDCRMTLARAGGLPAVWRHGRRHRRKVQVRQGLGSTHRKGRPGGAPCPPAT